MQNFALCHWFQFLPPDSHILLEINLGWPKHLGKGWKRRKINSNFSLVLNFCPFLSHTSTRKIWYILFDKFQVVSQNHLPHKAKPSQEEVISPFGKWLRSFNISHLVLTTEIVRTFSTLLPSWRIHDTSETLFALPKTHFWMF